MHKSVGAIIKKDNKILMVDRVNPPFGWAAPAGHVEEGENLKETLIKEIKEEVDLDIKKSKLLIHEFIPWNNCKKHNGHDWYVYEVIDWQGKAKRSKRETRNMKWVKIGDLKKINLEPVWEYWFKKLKIFN